MNKIHQSPLLEKYLSKWEKDPSSKVFVPLGQTYLKLGATQKAKEVLVEGIHAHPNYVPGYLALAATYQYEGSAEQAYKLLKPFVKDCLDNVKLQDLFGNICLDLKYFDQALQSFKYLLFLMPFDKKLAAKVKDLEDKRRPSLVERKVVEKKINKVEFNIDELKTDILDELSNKNEDDWNVMPLTSKQKTSFDKKSSFLSQRVKDAASSWKSEKLSKSQEIETPLQDQDTEITFKFAENNSPSGLVTHTLVDLYLSQGHVLQAIDVLEKILELNPSDHKTAMKLNELKNSKLYLTAIGNDVGDQSLLTIQTKGASNLAGEKNEVGQDNLMELYSQKIEERSEILDQFSDVLKETKVNIDHRLTQNELIKTKLGIFLAKIQQRALR